MNRLRAACYTSLICLATSCTPAPAAPLDKQMSDEVYQLALKLTELPDPPGDLIVRSLPQKDIANRVCHKPCSLKAAQVGNEVLVDSSLDMDDKFNVSILLHEFVHYLQWGKGGVAKNCDENAARETEAYEVQNHLLEIYGVSKRALNQGGTCV